MGTRSAVAELAETSAGWRGRYVHWDGYPEAVGKAVAQIVARDGLDKAKQVLLHDHFAWSSVDANSDVSYVRGDDVPVEGYGIAYGDEDANAWLADWYDSGIEYVYVMTEQGVVAYSGGGALLGTVQPDGVLVRPSGLVLPA